MSKSGFEKFLDYALRQGVHNGPATIRDLERTYNKHKGSRYSTIVALFKTEGENRFQKQYEDEVLNPVFRRERSRYGYR